MIHNVRPNEVTSYRSMQDPSELSRVCMVSGICATHEISRRIPIHGEFLKQLLVSAI